LEKRIPRIAGKEVSMLTFGRLRKSALLFLSLLVSVRGFLPTVPAVSQRPIYVNGGLLAAWSMGDMFDGLQNFFSGAGNQKDSNNDSNGNDNGQSRIVTIPGT
jgi:hypothetical protein